MSMILKRAATPSADVKPSTPATPPHNDSPSSNKKARTTTPKATSTPSNVVSPSSVRSDGKTARATFAMMVIEAGIKAVNKAEVEAATGLTAQQQKDMTRQGKGALRNALMERAGTFLRWLLLPITSATLSAKRSLLDEIDDFVSSRNVEAKPCPTSSSPLSPSLSKKPRKSSNVTPTKAKPNREDDASSLRAKFALMIIEYGIAHIPKDLVEAKTGLNAKQQADMTRRDKGALYKALKNSTEKM